MLNCSLKASDRWISRATPTPAQIRHSKFQSYKHEPGWLFIFTSHSSLWTQDSLQIYFGKPASLAEKNRFDLYTKVFKNINLTQNRGLKFSLESYFIYNRAQEPMKEETLIPNPLSGLVFPGHFPELPALFVLTVTGTWGVKSAPD